MLGLRDFWPVYSFIHIISASILHAIIDYLLYDWEKQTVIRVMGMDTECENNHSQLHSGGQTIEAFCMDRSSVRFEKVDFLQFTLHIV